MKPLSESSTENEAAPPISIVQPLSMAEQLKGAIERQEILSTALTASQSEVASLKEERISLAEQIKSLQENPLIFTLNNLDAGAVLEEAGVQMKELSAICLRRQDKGSLTVKLNVRPFKGSHGALIIEPEVKLSEPKAEPPQSVFYSSEEGDLSRNDPRQRELPLRDN